jgi:hypothetical protein
VQVESQELSDYIPADLKERYLGNELLLDRHVPTGRYNRPERVSSALRETKAKLEGEKPTDTIHAFISFLLQQDKFQNFVLLTATFQELHQLQYGLIQRGILPKGILKREGKTVQFRLPFLNITVACSKVYVDRDIWQVTQRGLTFFPTMVLHTSDWTRADTIPDLEAFLELQDSTLLVDLKKREYVKYQKGCWDPIQHLFDASRSMLYGLAESMLAYLKSGLETQVCVRVERESGRQKLNVYLLFQMRCIRIFGQPEAAEGYLPLLSPLFSPSYVSHTYNSFRLYEERGKLRLIRPKDENPTRRKISRVETGGSYVGRTGAPLSSTFLSSRMRRVLAPPEPVVYNTDGEWVSAEANVQ